MSDLIKITMNTDIGPYSKESIWCFKKSYNTAVILNTPRFSTKYKITDLVSFESIEDILYVKDVKESSGLQLYKCVCNINNLEDFYKFLHRLNNFTEEFGVVYSECWNLTMTEVTGDKYNLGISLENKKDLIERVADFIRMSDILSPELMKITGDDFNYHRHKKLVA